jgi:tRNA A-37 threonylcarbamoyl transferase component Bud32
MEELFRGRFQRERVLGKGGMGEVFLALDTFTQRHVAVKLIDLSAFDDPEIGTRVRKLWLNETRLAGKLRHPHIVEVFEAGASDEAAYLVMEYVDGTTLQAHAKPDKLLPIETVVEILYKVCNALDYANKLGLLHRDIKPANIMIGEHGLVKVTDFGACYLLNSDETQVFDVGTIPYVPPEHFRKMPPTMQTDIYAVGVMAYKLLTGALPFAPGSFEDLIQRKLADEFIPIDTRRPELPNELRFAVHRAMHGRPEVRYTTWTEFCDDLALALPQVARPREIVFETARYATLRKLQFFGGFSDAQLWEVVHMGRWSEKMAGETLFEQGDPGSTVYIVSHGRVAVSRDGATLNDLRPGECLGEIAYLDNTPAVRTATATATEPTVLIELDADALRQASAGLQAAFTKAFVEVLVGRLRNADRRFLDALAARS